jgi:TonB-dependent receptor
MLLVVGINSISAQTNNGTIKGTISDSETNGFLIGATIVLDGTKHYTTTGSDGQYTFGNVDSGTYTLKVSYIGFEDYTAEIKVNGSETVVHNISMKPSFESLSEVIVKGARFGQSKALNEQKEAINIKNIISEEQIQSFPDLNTAEVMQRISGVTIQRSQGEGRFISMRGTQSNFTNVLINGEQVAFSNETSRVVELDVVSAAQLSGIEVTKVITPDMDANSIGGTVNLKTKSAFDQDDMEVNITIGGGVHNISDGNNFRVAYGLSKIFGEKKNFGFSIGGNFAKTARERHFNRHRWGNRDDVNDNRIPFALRDSRVQFANSIRDRFGVNGQLEYRINDKNRIYVNGVYNFRKDDQDRQILRARFDKGDYISATEVEDMRFIRTIFDRVEKQELTAVNIGGEHQIGSITFDYNYSNSTAFTKDEDGRLKSDFRFKGVDVDLSNLTSTTPDWVVTNDEDINDGDEFESDGTELNFKNTTSDINIFSANISIPLNLGGDHGDIKFGGKFKTIDKDRNDKQSFWEWEGDDDLLLSQFESITANLSLENGYNFGRIVNRNAFREFFFANQVADAFEGGNNNAVNLGEPYDAKEEITGFYAMTTQTFGNLLVVAGIRAESTDLDYTATNLVVDDDEFVSSEQQNVKRSYDFIFPNLQFRYRVSPKTNIRLAYSKGIAPPNFFDAMPFSFTDLDEDEIERGNPNLNPTESNNFDLLGEHFFKGIGILSGGVFYKQLDNFIFESDTEQSGGDFDGFDVKEFINGEGADLFGVEVSWQQQFTKLPGFLSGFGIFLNYTYTTASNINLGPNFDREIDRLPAQIENSGNVALSYEKGRFVAKLSTNFNDKFIDVVGDDTEEDIWRDSQMFVDFSGSFRVAKGLNLFFQLNNLTDEVRFDYLGRKSRAIEYNITGMTMDFGIKWSL